jgi:transcriptional regulator with XRE-family HTH domain
MHPDSSPAAGETIGERLKRLRLERGFSQRELAAPGVSYAYISRIEAGTRQPSVKALRRLAVKLNVSADYLERGSDLDPEAERELRLSDIELAIRLGEWENAEEPLQAAVEEAVAAGDRAAILRGRDEPFAPAERLDVYGSLGRAYTEAGRPIDAVELFERCMRTCADTGDATTEARYAIVLSYVLSDMGELARAEHVVRRALDRVEDTADPYMRVRLYWSVARLAHAEGRESVALTNVRKAIALLQATDDNLHLGRAHILAAYITLAREDPETAEKHLDHAEQYLGLSPAPQDLFEMTTQRARIAALRGEAERAIALGARAVELAGDESPADRGVALAALADGLALTADAAGASKAYSEAVDLLEAQGLWRHAATASLAWGRMLRHVGREDEALDVLDRAAALGMRATPESAHAER